MPRQTGSQCFAEMVRGYGLHAVFFVPTILYPALAAMEGWEIKRVMTHGEKAAAYMADGYARAGRRPGIAMAQMVGAANLAAGLKDAFLYGSPVIALTGGPDPQHRHRGVYQEADDRALFAPLTKWQARVDRVDRLPDLLRQAFRVAVSGIPGPVHLELRGHMGQVLEEEADLERVIEETFATYPPFRPVAEPERVRAALEALRRAERPVIVADAGVIVSDAGPEVVALAERLRIPVATSLDAKEIIPATHPLAIGVAGTYARWCANRLLREADLVFFIGSTTASQVTGHWQCPPLGTRTVQLHIAPEEIGRNYAAPLGLCGDPKATLQAMLAQADEGPARTDWLSRAEQVVAEWRAEQAPRRQSDAHPMRPERLCWELSAWLPPDAVLVSDTGHAGIWTGTMVDLQYPTQRYLRAAGSLGWALPAALGAKCALPDRPVVCFTGDGGFYYHLAELETAVRYHLPVVIVVNDNRSLNQEIWSINAAYGGDHAGRGAEMWMFADFDLARVAERLGCLGLRVEHPAEVQSALDTALAAGRPAVVDVVTDVAAVADRVRW
ncbi:MAG: thiamine pyrophosphate-binding protein [Chloroflexi bacterium]|nr:thiamine pyrophosphate-binding protein [Chloroflexota bacterium]